RESRPGNHATGCLALCRRDHAQGNGINVLQETKVVLNLYLEEIHVIAKNENIRTLNQLEAKKVSVGPEKSGSALTAEVLLSGYGLKIDAVFDAPEDAVQKLSKGEIDAL